MLCPPPHSSAPGKTLIFVEPRHPLLPPLWFCCSLIGEALDNSTKVGMEGVWENEEHFPGKGCAGGVRGWPYVYLPFVSWSLFYCFLSSLLIILS